MLRVLVCDDSAPAREAVRALLAQHTELEIVGEAENGEQAVALAAELAPDVVLMDVSMPLVDGVAAARRIHERWPSIRIVALAGSAETETVMAMMDAGASAYCLKGAPLWELERAIGGGKEPLMRLAHALARSAASGKGELVARELAQLTGADLAAVFVAESRFELALSAVAGRGVAGYPAKLDDVARQAVRGSMLVRAGEALAVPLVADGVTLGALVVSSSDAADAELVSSVADLAAASLAADRRLEASREEARRDALTGLANRRAFEERLEWLVRRGREASVVLLDLDDFKAINDTRGHAAGDAVLRRVGLALSRVVRADEGLFRIGGEEFAILVEAETDVALAVAERARRALGVQGRGEPLPTVSVGIASMPADAADAQDLLRKADAALYAAKWDGKDRVLAYSAEVSASVRPAPDPLAPLPARVLLVDDDAPFRMLLRTTLEPADMEVDEAGDAVEAGVLIAARRPDVIVLDVHMPGVDGLSLCRRLKEEPATCEIAVVLLTGDDTGEIEAAASAARADAFLRKPFSPLELLNVVERVAAGHRVPARGEQPVGGQVELFANDLRRVLEIERGQRRLLQKAYREAVTALATALESKDTGTKEHSQRVQLYALALAEAVDPRLLDEPSLEYGFLLHDVGKIGIPDRILLKRAGLTDNERRLMQTHPVLGEQMLSDVALLRGEGLKVVRSHHERWDGSGYPDALRRRDIPLGARIFAVADTLDAMTSDRPYRQGVPWDDAVAEIGRQAGVQFDPDVVRAFMRREPVLRRVREQLAVA
jgi:diguanylate cyclase (GGDEF)-like protein